MVNNDTLEDIPVRERSIPRSRRNYRDLCQKLDASEAQLLAERCYELAANPSARAGLTVTSEPSGNPLQYLAYAAYWCSIADHIRHPVAS